MSVHYQVITDRVSETSNAICPIRLFVCPFVFTLSFEQTDLWPWFFLCMVYYHSSSGIKSQGNRSISKAVTQSVLPRSSIESSFSSVLLLCTYFNFLSSLVFSRSEWNYILVVWIWRMMQYHTMNTKYILPCLSMGLGIKSWEWEKMWIITLFPLTSSVHLNTV